MMFMIKQWDIHPQVSWFSCNRRVDLLKSPCPSMVMRDPHLGRLLKAASHCPWLTNSGACQLDKWWRCMEMQWNPPGNFCFSIEMYWMCAQNLLVDDPGLLVWAARLNASNSLQGPPCFRVVAAPTATATSAGESPSVPAWKTPGQPVASRCR